jgi:parvulin-like peptidyl-prolyl isomerase
MPPTDAMPKADNTPPAVAPADAVSAVVNGVPVTADAVEEELTRLLMEPGLHDSIAEDRRRELRAKALDELVVRELAYQDARAKGVTASPRATKAAVDKVRARYHSVASFNEALLAEGITAQELEQQAERDIIIENYYRTEIDRKARVTEREVKQLYQENLARYVMPESLHLLAIFVEIHSGDEATAMQKIDQAFADLQSGVAFDAVAYKFSEDDYAVMGGDYKTVHKGQLSPDLEKVAFSAKENEIVGPVQTSVGWFIVRVDNKRPEHQVPYAEVRDKLMKSLSAARLSELRAQLIARLRASATIEYVTATPSPDGAANDAIEENR